MVNSMRIRLGPICLLHPIQHHPFPLLGINDPHRSIVQCLVPACMLAPSKTGLLLQHEKMCILCCLQDKHHKRKAAAAVLPVRVGDEGMALESSFKDGLKHEVLRSLCQLVNSSELALEVSPPPRPPPPHPLANLTALFA